MKLVQVNIISLQTPETIFTFFTSVLDYLHLILISPEAIILFIDKFAEFRSDHNLITSS